MLPLFEAILISRVLLLQPVLSSMFLWTFEGKAMSLRQQGPIFQ